VLLQAIAGRFTPRLAGGSKILIEKPDKTMRDIDDPGRAREAMRGVLAIAVVVLLAGAGAGVFFLSWVGRSDDASAFSQSIFTAVVGLTGTVMGFYFGSQAAAR
jgi:hypothetical protein